MTSLFSSDKKGQLPGKVFSAIVILFSISIMFIFSSYFAVKIIEGYQSSSVYVSAMEQPINGFLRTINFFDTTMVIILVLLIIGVAITSYVLAPKPIFFIINMIMCIIYGILSYAFNIIFFNIVSNALFSTIVLRFPKTILICTNLHWVALALFVVGSIASFIGGGGQQGEIINAN